MSFIAGEIVSVVEYRDIIRRKPYFLAYQRVSESAYARARIVVPLTPVDPGL